MILLESSAAPPATATGEADEVHHEPEKSRCPLACNGVEEDTHSEEQDEAIGDEASTGAAPQHLRPPDPNIRPETITSRRRSRIRPSNNQNPHRPLRIEAKERLRRPHLKDEASSASNSNGTSPYLSEDAGGKRLRDEEEAGKPYSATTTTSSPRRRRPDTHIAEEHPPGETRLHHQRWRANPSTAARLGRRADTRARI